MPWGWRWWRRGRWPGNGPFSYLPPWERPGWVYGRGWCWQYLNLEIERNKTLEERIEKLEEEIKKLREEIEKR